LTDCPQRDKIRSSTVSRLQKESVSSVLFSLVDQLSDNGAPVTTMSTEEKLIHALQISEVSETSSTLTAAATHENRESDTEDLRDDHLVEDMFFF
jgi:hypothetical protein